MLYIEDVNVVKAEQFTLYFEWNNPSKNDTLGELSVV